MPPDMRIDFPMEVGYMKKRRLGIFISLLKGLIAAVAAIVRPVDAEGDDVA